MKARTKKTRWLLIALLFGFLAAAGLTLTHFRGAGTAAKANGAAPPTHPVSHQRNGVLLASIGGKQPLWVPGSAGPEDELVVRGYSNIQAPHVTGHSGTPSSTPSNTSTAVATGWSNDSSDPAGTQLPSNRPSTSATSHVPQSAAGNFANNSYVPLDCELPAGCGANGGGGIVSRQPSGTSGGMPGVHNSGSTPPNGGSGPQTNDNTNPGSPGLNTDPTNGDPKDPPVASAPELDPATLAGAVTLLLGALAVLRSRRARANG